MAVSLTDLGKIAFTYSLIIAVASTAVGLALAGAGVDPSVMDLPIMYGMKHFYSIVYRIYGGLPKNSTDIGTFLRVSGTLLSGAFLEFILSFGGSFLLLVHALAQVLPPEVGFLTAPLYFVAAFMQVALWVYLLKSVRDILSWIA